VADNTANEFVLNGPDAKATGELVDDGFVVRAGALARKEIVPSAMDSVARIRSPLLSNGVLVEEDGQLRFTKDHQFASPSAASSAVLGRSSNGWVEWQQADGRTLSEVKRITRPANEAMLTDVKRQQIIEKHEELLNEGRIYNQAELSRRYETFRALFGPDALKRLDGAALLEFIHDLGNRDSLVYWLEFNASSASC
jgi:5-methylcytosine-specific restriction protein B